MNFGIRWSDECLEDLERIYGSQKVADAAMFSIDWRLSRNPLADTWDLKQGNPIKLAWVKQYLHYPPVYLSFEIVIQPNERYCHMLKARVANDPATS